MSTREAEVVVELRITSLQGEQKKRGNRKGEENEREGSASENGKEKECHGVDLRGIERERKGKSSFILTFSEREKNWSVQRVEKKKTQTIRFNFNPSHVAFVCLQLCKSLRLLRCYLACHHISHTEHHASPSEIRSHLPLPFLSFLLISVKLIVHMDEK